jgi:hypothetical protein
MIIKLVSIFTLIISLAHQPILISQLLLLHQLQYLHQILLKPRKYTLSVLCRPLMSVQSIHAVRHSMLWERCTRASNILVVDDDHAELRRQHHGFGEHRNKLIQLVLTLGLTWIVDEDDAVSVLLDGRPAFLVLHVSRAVPQLNVDLAKVNAWGRVSLEINNPIIHYQISLYTCIQ